MRFCTAPPLTILRCAMWISLELLCARQRIVWAVVDAKTAEKLKGAAWWLARGWTRQQIDTLLSEAKSPVDFDKIKNSAGFCAREAESGKRSCGTRVGRTH